MRLQPGERLLDIGCGWGALVMRAAQKFGAQALGRDVEPPQHEEAQRRIAEAGVGDRVRVELRDYRDLRGETFDKIVSVGMVEHVGRERLRTYFRTVYDALREGGLFLNHGIARQSRDGKGYRGSGFIDRYVFPDGDLVNVDTMLRAGESVGFEVRDVENLREHYARTLRAWYANLEAAARRGHRRDRRAHVPHLEALHGRQRAQFLVAARWGSSKRCFAQFAQSPGQIPATRRDLYA